MTRTPSDPAPTSPRAIASRALGAVWSVIRAPFVFALQLLGAIIVLFEEWGWRPLAALLARLARFPLWATLELWIAGLPPYAALAVFGLPTTLLFPLKLLSIWLLANGYIGTAGALFVAAKIASTALVARLFMLTKPALMRIGWFARAYNAFVPWKEHYFGIIRSSWAWRYGRVVKTRVRLDVKQAWMRWRPALATAWAGAAVWARDAALRARRAWRDYVGL